MLMIRFGLLCAGLFLLQLSGACAEEEIPTECTDNSDCFTDLGYVCAQVSQGQVGTQKICLQGCVQGADCLETESCDLSDPAQGVCRFNANSSSGGTNDTDTVTETATNTGS